MSIDPIVAVEQWLKHVKKRRKELDNMSICPFASKLPIVKPVVVIDTNIIELNDNMVIYVEQSKLTSFDDLEKIAKLLNKQYNDYVFMPDHFEHNTYIGDNIRTNNNHFPILMQQKKIELINARESLNKNYYKHYSNNYLNILKNYGK